MFEYVDRWNLKLSLRTTYVDVKGSHHTSGVYVGKDSELSKLKNGEGHKTAFERSEEMYTGSYSFLSFSLFPFLFPLEEHRSVVQAQAVWHADWILLAADL